MLLDGRTVASHILENLSLRVSALEKEYKIQPHLAVIVVGDDPATKSYVAQKEKKAKEIGAVVSVYNHPEDISQEKLQESIDFLQQDSSIHGIILQLPIPKHLDSQQLIASIDPQKDVDGFTQNSPFVVPIAAAIMKLLEIVYEKEDQHPRGEKNAVGNSNTSGVSSFNFWLRSRLIVIMGKGATGGKPITDALRAMGIVPSVIDSQTTNREQITNNADIIITAVGKRGVLTKNMVKKDVILLNVGMTRGDDEKFYGDYDENDIKDIASWYTPTPGGVGPVNVACLLENLVIAAEKMVKN